MFNHCYRIRHGITEDYIWLYQQHHMSHLDRNGAIVYSISFITDVTQLIGVQLAPSWSVTEKKEDGSSVFLTGSLKDIKDRDKLFFSGREKQILSLAAKGYSSHLISNQLRISYQTVVTHKKSVLRKTKSKNMTEAIAYALNLGFL